MKPLTFSEICERLQRLDEVSLLELLGIDSEELVRAFAEKIENSLEKLEKEVDD